MATFSGTATDPFQLFDILINSMKSMGWTEKARAHVGNPVVDTERNYEYVWMRGYDYAGDGEFYIQFNLDTTVSTNSYRISMGACPGWTDGADITSISSFAHNSYNDGGTIDTGSTMRPCFGNSGTGFTRNQVRYWFNINPRRIVGAAQNAAGAWFGMYAGLFLPYATNDQYPLPLMVSGDFIYFGGSSRPQANFYGGPLPSVAMRTNSCGSVFLPQGIWTLFCHNATYFSNDSRGVVFSAPYVIPFGSRVNGQTTGTPMYSSEVSPAGWSERPIEDFNGKEYYPLQPIWLFSQGSTPRGIYGELDGVYQIPEWGAANGDIITTIDNHKVLVFGRAGIIIDEGDF